MTCSSPAIGADKLDHGRSARLARGRRGAPGGIVRRSGLERTLIALAGAVGCGWALGSLSPAFADTAAPGGASPAVQEVVVTGSHIPRPGLTSVSPLTSLSQTQISAQGLLRVEDLISRLPQAYVGQGSNVTNAATGTATVDLRQLGAERTLVLIDGKRLMPGDPTSGSIAPDLNFVPTALIDRIEIVTGGASAVYGSDAIAGVVNILLDTRLQGLKLKAQGGVYDHENGDRAIQAILTAKGIALPPKHVDDGWAYSLDGAVGWRLGGDRDGVELYGGYRQADPVTEAERDFSSCFLVASGDEHVCQGSARSPALGRFVVYNPTTFTPVAILSLDPDGPTGSLRDFSPTRDAYNSAPYQYFQRPDIRWTGGGFGRFDVSDRAQAYLQGMFMDDRTTAQLGPSGLFGATLDVNCSDPLLSAAEVQGFCTSLGLGPGDRTLLTIARRNVEGGPRQYELFHRDWRLLGGLRGDLGAWRYDVSAQFAAVRMKETVLDEVSVSHAIDALNVVATSSGALACASGANGCTPYDIFAIGGVTQSALDYISVPAHAGGSTGEAVLSALISGDLGAYGLTSPWATRGVSVAFGMEHRRESLSYAPDAELADGDLASSIQAEPPVSGAFHVDEVFGEVRAPLAEDRWRWMHALAFEAGLRYSRYSTAGDAWTYKAGAEWSPTADLRIRTSYNHAVRAPNVVDLFTPQTVSPGGLGADPCAGSNPLANNPLATPANCARTGVASGLYGLIADNPDGYNSLDGGNPDLKPEIANTFTADIVLTPHVLPGLTLTADWFDIVVTNVLGAIGADQILEQCLETGDAFYCRLVHRAAGTGSLWIGQGYVSDVVENTASLKAMGVDVEAGYRRPLPRLMGNDLGEASLDLVGSYAISRQRRTAPGSPTYDCAGLYGPTCGSAMPRWRHVLSLGWKTPWGVDVDGAWRYVAPVGLDLATTNPILSGPYEAADTRLSARSYFDLSAAWRIGPRFTWRIGADNILDQDPPLVGFAGGIGNGNTTPGLYDVLGRYLFSSLTARF